MTGVFEMAKCLNEAIKRYYDENSVTLPEFVQWAEYVHINDSQAAIQQAIEQAYAKGLSLGYQAGYKDAKDEWWREQDKEITKLVRGAGEKD
jgi:flagellar biosynthesis/type III secretory pathway protein FliH